MDRTNWTWAKLVAVEPRLNAIEQLTYFAAPAPGDEPDWREWEGVKRQLARLVGRDAAKRELRACAAYDVAYDYLLDVWERREDAAGSAAA